MVDTLSSRLSRSFKPAFFQYCRTSGIGGGSTSRYATNTVNYTKYTKHLNAMPTVKGRGNGFKAKKRACTVEKTWKNWKSLHLRSTTASGTELGEGGQGRGAAVLLSKRREHNMEQRFCWNLSITPVTWT